MTDSNTNLIWVVLFRTIQTALDAAPTLLCGLFAAGLIRGMIGPAAVRRWFTDDPRVGPVRAWFTGLLLPVCSFGVLPVAWELKRAGTPRATVLTFLLAAPLMNPFSLIYAFQSLEGEGTLGMAALAVLLVGSFIILVGTGILVGLWLPDRTASPDRVASPDLPPLPDSGLRRLGIVALTIARGLTGTLQFFLAIGLVGAGLLAIVPGGAVERAVIDRSFAAPLHLALVSAPFQAAPARGIVLVCESILGGVPLGSAFVLFLLGIGINLGTLAWIWSSYGLRIAACALSLVIGGALAVGYVIPTSISDLTSDAVKTRHFLEIESQGGYKVAKARAIRATVTNDAGQPQWFLITACAALGAFWLAALLSSLLGERGTISHVMTHGSANRLNPKSATWSKPLSNQQCLFAGMALAIVVVVAGLYIYYPAPNELINQMESVQIDLAEALKSTPAHRPEAMRLVAKWQRLQSKIVVADLLRRGSIEPAVRAANSQLRSEILRLRSAIGDDSSSPEKLNSLCHEAREAANKCREALDRKRSR